MYESELGEVPNITTRFSPYFSRFTLPHFDHDAVSNKTMKGINLKLLTASAAAATTKTYTIPSYADFPNSALHGLPLLIYRPFEHADDDGLDPDEVERLLRKNGLQPAWRYGMYVRISQDMQLEFI